MSDVLGRYLQESRARDERLVRILAPLLTPGAKSKIVTAWEDICKRCANPSSDWIINSHLNILIINLDYEYRSGLLLSEGDMYDLAETLNKDPLYSSPRFIHA